MKKIEGQTHNVIAEGYKYIETKERGRIRTTSTGDAPVPYRAAKTPGRNEACSCGSGAKYKKCCSK